MAAAGIALGIDIIVKAVTGKGSWTSIGIDAVLTFMPWGRVAKLARTVPALARALDRTGEAVTAGRQWIGDTLRIGRKIDSSLGWTGEAGLSLTPAQNTAVDEYLARVASHEPAITARLQHIADEIPDAELTGLDYRLKGANSLKRKISMDLTEDMKATVGDVIDQVNDSVRYTFTLPDSTYATGSEQALNRLRQEGFDIVKVKNFWAQNANPYRGINATIRDSSTGQLAEAQFHTPTSFHAKNVEAHPLYEKLRVPGLTETERATLEAEMRTIFGRVTTPLGAAGVGS